MFKRYGIPIISIVILISTIRAEVVVTVVKSSGNVKVRYGLEEEWQQLALGSKLKDFDTILTGEKSEAVVQFENGATFKLGSNSVLDIGDLRKIYEKELFLYLMSKKVESMEPRYEKTPLRIGNVSVVHGELKEQNNDNVSNQNNRDWAEWEINGAVALQNQGYHPNAIIKLHSILDKYTDTLDKGKIYFYIAGSLEALKMYGQAMDAFDRVIKTYSEKSDISSLEKERLIASRQAVERLELQN